MTFYLFQFRNNESFKSAAISFLVDYKRATDSGVTYINATSFDFLYCPRSHIKARNISKVVLKSAFICLKRYLLFLFFRLKLYNSSIKYRDVSAQNFFRFVRAKIRIVPLRTFLSTDINSWVFPNGVNVLSVLHHDLSLFLKIHDFNSINLADKALIYNYFIEALAFYDFIGSYFHFLTPKDVLLLHEGYSFNQIIKLRLDSSNILFYTHPSHLNVCFDYLDIAVTTLVTKRRIKSIYWNALYNRSIPNLALFKESLSDLSVRLSVGGSHIYSPSIFSIVEQSQSYPKKKPIVSLFTSSLDEFQASISLQNIFNQELPCESQLFRSQEHAIEMLSRFASDQQDFHLVIRHHPRLGAVKDSRHSQYLAHLLDAAVMSDSLTVLLPNSPVSSYALIMDSALVLNCWSNIGLEALRLGKRVANLFSEFYSVCYWPQSLFPPITNLGSLYSLIHNSIFYPEKDLYELSRRCLLAHSFYVYFNLASLFPVPALDLSVYSAIDAKISRNSLSDFDFIYTLGMDSWLDISSVDLRMYFDVAYAHLKSLLPGPMLDKSVFSTCQ